MEQQLEKLKFIFPSVIQLPTNCDERGALTAIESRLDIPFSVNRVYMLHDINVPRGGHAHRETNQLLIAASGTCKVILSDVIENKEFRLDSPTKGLLIGHMTWIELSDISPESLVLVLASTHYDSSKVIRNWDVFVQEKKKNSIKSDSKGNIQI